MIFLYILLGLAIVIAFLAFIAPKGFYVSRSIIIKKDQQEIFHFLRSLEKQNLWSPWGTRDPNMKSEFKGKDGEVGSIHHWTGNKEVGEGEQEITGLTPNSRIDTELRFIKPFKASNKGFFDLEPVQGGTKLTWGFSGINHFPFHIMMMFMNMDKTVGKDFEEGLTNLKKLLEKEEA